MCKVANTSLRNWFFRHFNIKVLALLGPANLIVQPKMYMPILDFTPTLEMHVIVNITNVRTITILLILWSSQWPGSGLWARIGSGPEI